MKQTKFRNAGIFLLLLSVLCICIGFYKMFVYENGEYSWSSHKNVYVGGDAYNFIINGTYATAFFVLGIGGMISGMLCLIGDGIIVTLQENGNNYTRKDGMAKVTETAKMQEVPVMPVQSNAAKVEAEAEVEGEIDVLEV